MKTNKLIRLFVYFILFTLGGFGCMPGTVEGDSIVDATISVLPDAQVSCNEFLCDDNRLLPLDTDRAQNGFCEYRNTIAGTCPNGCAAGVCLVGDDAGPSLDATVADTGSSTVADAGMDAGICTQPCLDTCDQGGEYLMKLVGCDSNCTFTGNLVNCRLTGQVCAEVLGQSAQCVFAAVDAGDDAGTLDVGVSDSGVADSGAEDAAMAIDSGVGFDSGVVVDAGVVADTGNGCPSPMVVENGECVGQLSVIAAVGRALYMYDRDGGRVQPFPLVSAGIEYTAATQVASIEVDGWTPGSVEACHCRYDNGYNGQCLQLRASPAGHYGCFRNMPFTLQFDAGITDTGVVDAGVALDATASADTSVAVDVGVPDAGVALDATIVVDTGVEDAAVQDANILDAAAADALVLDATASADSGTSDAASDAAVDAGDDAGTLDVGVSDSGVADSGAEDAATATDSGVVADGAVVVDGGGSGDAGTSGGTPVCTPPISVLFRGACVTRGSDGLWPKYMRTNAGRTIIEYPFFGPPTATRVATGGWDQAGNGVTGMVAAGWLSPMSDPCECDTPFYTGACLPMPASPSVFGCWEGMPF